MAQQPSLSPSGAVHQDVAVEYVPIEALHPTEYNPRKWDAASGDD